MIKEKAMELVAALRSGKYTQTQGALKDNTGYDCLGVATEIAGIKFVDRGGGEFETDEDYPSVVILPDKAQAYFDFYSSSGHRRDEKLIVIDGVESLALADANDKGATFAQIADYIEANWEAL